MFEDYFGLALRNSKLQLNSRSGDPCGPPRIVDFQYLFQTNKTVGFYFVQQSSVGCRTFSHQLRDLYNKLRESSPTTELQKHLFGSPAKIRRFFNGCSRQKQKNSPAVLPTNNESFEVILVSLDQDEGSYQRTLSENPGWWALPFSNRILRNRLIRFFEVQSGPALIIVDCIRKTLITKDGRRAMQDDPEGTKFPWLCQSFEEIFTGSVLSNKDQSFSAYEAADLQSFSGRKKGILFSANWCPPCRCFVRQLVQTYKNINSRGECLEIILCSSDRSVESYNQHFSGMPWLAFPFGDERIRMATKLFNVHGIPALFVLDENNKLITKHGKNEVLADPEGKEFPWYPKPVMELTEFTVSLLREEISVVLFTEGNEDDPIFAQGVMGNIAENELMNRRTASVESPDSVNQQSNGNLNTTSSIHSNAKSDGAEKPFYLGTAGTLYNVQIESAVGLDPLQFFFTGEDPICDQILDSLGLQDAPLPLVCILDVLGEAVYICDEPDVSDHVVRNFLEGYRRGAVQPRRISQTEVGRLCGVAHVGGIPLNAISAALGMSPQNSMGQSVIVESEIDTKPAPP